MDAGGDGLDSNGNFEMTDGIVLVNGPTNNGNGPLDYMSSLKISGGFLVAVGSAGMAQTPSEDSTQYSVMQILNNVQAAGTMVYIETAAGEDVLTFLPTKEYQSVLISSPELQNGESYVVYTGGSSISTPVDGLYTDGDSPPPERRLPALRSRASLPAAAAECSAGRVEVVQVDRRSS
jgi:hypothetical protein